MEEMRRFGMRFLDENNEWQETWPPNQQQSSAAATPGLPRATEVELELDDLGTLKWVFVLPQNYVPTPQTAAQGAGEASEGEDEAAKFRDPAAENAEPRPHAANAA